MSIPFISRFDFEYGEVDQISPLVQRVIADNPGPFTFTGTGVYIVGSGNDVAVIDPGPLGDAHEAALDRVLNGRRVSHVLLTHHHSDHSPLAAPLAAKHGCPVYGRPVGRRTSEKIITLDAGDDPSFSPDVTINDGDVFSGSDWTLKAIHTPGHTSNHICFALEEENTLFSGDHIMSWATSVVIPPNGHMGDYFESLERISDMGFDRICPSHGAPIEEVRPFVEAYIQHRLDREAQIIGVLSAGPSLIMPIVKQLYQHVDERLYPAAGMSVLAHLIHLRETGRVSADGADGLDTVYTLET